MENTKKSQNENTKKQTKMKEQENSPEEELDEIEARNVSDREFRLMIIKILNSMKKGIETIKKGQSEIKNAVSERNNTLEGINLSLIHISEPTRH